MTLRSLLLSKLEISEQGLFLLSFSSLKPLCAGKPDEIMRLHGEGLDSFSINSWHRFLRS